MHRLFQHNQPLSFCTLPPQTPITEDTPLGCISPYGRTKLFQEDMFR